MVSPEVYYIQGGAYLDMEDWDNALDCFKKASALLNQNKPVAHGYHHSMLEDSVDNIIEQLSDYIKENNY